MKHSLEMGLIRKHFNEVLFEFLRLISGCINYTCLIDLRDILYLSKP